MDPTQDQKSDRERLAEMEYRRRRYEAGHFNSPIIGESFYRWEILSREKVPEEIQQMVRAATNDSFEIIHDEYAKVDGINGTGPSFHLVRVIARGASPSQDLLYNQNFSLQHEALNDRNVPWPMGRPAEPTRAYMNIWLPMLVKHFVGPTDRYKDLRKKQKAQRKHRHIANRARIAKKAHQGDLQLMEQALPYLSSKRWEGGRGRAMPNDWKRPFRKTARTHRTQITVPDAPQLELV